MQLTHRSQLMDFTLWLAMSHESCDAEYESHRIRVRGGTWVYKAASGRSVVRSPRNHLSTILPMIPLYDFRALHENMRPMLYDRTMTVVGYYIQHRQEPSDRHLLSLSSLGLWHLVASPLSILDDHPGDYDKENPQDCKPIQGEHLGWGEGLTA